MLRNVIILLVFLATATALGFIVIITPDNPLVGLFRESISENENAKVVSGPYPLEKDFGVLKTNGVTTIISLLNPEIPYERVLLDKERALAEEHGIQVLNFPLTSILGQRFGADYDSNAQAAAKAAVEAPGKVYIHCYLGMHRAKVVIARMERQQPGVATDTYAMRQGEREQADKVSDGASAAYRTGDYDKAIALLSSLDERNDSQELLRAWSHYRKGDLAQARSGFEIALRHDAGNVDANLGLGFVALRENSLAVAEKHFAAAAKDNPNDPQAWTGLGLTHYRMGQATKARSELEKAVKLDPNNSDARAVLTKLAVKAQ